MCVYIYIFQLLVNVLVIGPANFLQIVTVPALVRHCSGMSLPLREIVGNAYLEVHVCLCVWSTVNFPDSPLSSTCHCFRQSLLSLTVCRVTVCVRVCMYAYVNACVCSSTISPAARFHLC